MTLVLSALTRDAVLQASDRHLVWIQDGAVIDKDDMANKAVLYCGRRQHHPDDHGLLDAELAEGCRCREGPRGRLSGPSSARSDSCFPCKADSRFSSKAVVR